jgi:hypothetical protein
LSSSKLLLDAPVLVVASQAAVLVGIDLQRNTVVTHELRENPQVARRAFVLDEVGATEDLAGGIVDAAHQAQARTASLEPVMGATVPKNHPSSSRSTFSPLTSFLCLTASRRGYLLGSQKALHRATTDLEFVNLKLASR